jgi:hypothetical protein
VATHLLADRRLAREARLSARQGVGSVQEAEIPLRPGDDEQWPAAWLDGLGPRYWLCVEQAFRGLLRVRVERGSVAVVPAVAPLRLMRFAEEERVLAADFAQVRWRICDGLLVARAGRDRGRLTIEARRAAPDRVLVRVVVEGFHPRLPAPVYSPTQLRAHEAVGRRFLRSLFERTFPGYPADDPEFDRRTA